MKPLDKNAMVQITLGTLITLTNRGEDCEQYERWYREEKLLTVKVPLFENALEKAALVIMHYQKYVDSNDYDLVREGKSRDSYLGQARVYEENFKELIKEIKQVKGD